MNIKTIKKAIGHERLIELGWRLTNIKKGFFKKDGIEIITPILEYKKNRLLGKRRVKYYNRFGLIYEIKI